MVRTTLAGRTVERPARLLRLLGDIDPMVRFARVLVEVEDPYDRAGAHPGEYPLLIGSYVEVVLHGRPLEGVIRLSRRVLHEGQRVFCVDEDGILHVHRVELAWEDGDDVFVSGGLEDGERYLVSSLPGAVEGMELEARPAPAASGPAAGERTP